MTIGSIAVRYATALLEYANELKVADKVYRESLQLKESFLSIPELRMAMNNPLLEPAKKATLIEQAVGTGMTAEFKRFVQLVLDQKRENLLLFRDTSYIGLYRKQENISVGSLITATEPSPAVVERIRRMVMNETKGRCGIDERTLTLTHSLHHNWY